MLHVYTYIVESSLQNNVRRAYLPGFSLLQVHYYESLTYGSYYRQVYIIAAAVVGAPMIITAMMNTTCSYEY